MKLPDTRYISVLFSHVFLEDRISIRLFENLPAPPKHDGSVFDVLADLQSFCRPGRTRQSGPMTDFYRKVNKFWKNFAKCDPDQKPNLEICPRGITSQVYVNS